MPIVLETDADRDVEQYVMQRIITELGMDARPIRLPRMSALDFFLDDGDVMRAGIEIKTRKESMKTIQGYGGLMLKHRKLLEMQQLAQVLCMPIFIAFAFQNGRGSVLLAEPMKIIDVEPLAPPVRRNFRGLACDNEPVIYLDWSRHLMRII